MPAVAEYDLTDQNETIAIMVARGHGDKEIGLEFGMRPAHVQSLKRSPLFMLRVKQLHSELLQDGTVLKLRMNHVAEKALDCLEEIVSIPVKDDIALLKLQAEHAQAILSKSGFGDTSNINMRSQNQSIAAILSPEEMQELRVRHAH